MEDVVAGVEQRLYDGSMFMGKPIPWWHDILHRLQQLGITEPSQIYSAFGAPRKPKPQAKLTCKQCAGYSFRQIERDGSVMVDKCVVCGGFQFHVEAPPPC